MTTYKESGVDIDLGDKVSEILFNAAIHTWKNAKRFPVECPFEDFRGARYIDISKLPKGTIMGANCDGIGTKVEIGERLDHFSDMAFDLIAMAVDDTVKSGGVPVLYTNVIDVNSLGTGDERLRQVENLAIGMMAAAEQAGIAVINGEVAELGNRVGGYGPFNLNWSGTVTWIGHKDRLFTGHEIKPGMKVVALREYGFRSNGVSLVRKIMNDHYGAEWHEERKDLAHGIMHPSTIYCPAIVDMFGGYDSDPKAHIAGFVHVTGGGIPGKLGSALRASQTGAVLDDLFEPCSAMRELQQLGSVPDDEMYRAWNCGQGGLVITNTVDDVVKIANEHGFTAKPVGEITAEPGIYIKSQGQEKNGEVLKF
ncbi:MAG: hypothetical protein KJ574_00865 [Nanoarchaeota archaeon]|nr:hypothetical protein [Nanoarchaeota archaeon]